MFHASLTAHLSSIALAWFEQFETPGNGLAFVGHILLNLPILNTHNSEVGVILATEQLCWEGYASDGIGPDDEARYFKRGVVGWILLRTSASCSAMSLKQVKGM